MKELKIQVKKDDYEDIVSCKNDFAKVKLTESLKKRIYEEDGKTIINFDKVIVNKMFSNDYVEKNFLKIDIVVNEVFVYFDMTNIEIDANNVKPISEEICIDKKDKDESIVIKESLEWEETDEDINEEDGSKLLKVDGAVAVVDFPMKEKVEHILDEICKNEKTIVVGIPQVIIKPNGVIFGQRKKLPIRNDQEIRIALKSEEHYFLYDMTEDEYIGNMKNYFGRILRNNFLFLWRKKCEYKEVNGRRFTRIYYATRRYANESGRNY